MSFKKVHINNVFLDSRTNQNVAVRVNIRDVPGLEDSSTLEERLLTGCSVISFPWLTVANGWCLGQSHMIT